MSAFIDQLRIGEVREIKLGKSFRRGKTINGAARNVGDNDSFHTIRYDFKPASVDLNKVSTIEIDSNKSTIIAPNFDGSGFPHTVFKGPCKPHSKECVLIIDNDTGEITLERLSQNIVVKKTRAEGTSKVKLPQRPITPSLDTVSSKKSSPSTTSVPQQSFPSSYSSSQPRTSPKCNENIFKTATPIIENQPTSNKRVENLLGTNDDAMIGILSESSNDSSDNESSSSDSSSESGSESSDDENDSGNIIANPSNQVKSIDSLNMPLLSAGQLISNTSSVKPSQNDFSSSESNLDSSDDDDGNEETEDHHNSDVPNLNLMFNSRDRPLTGSAFQSKPNVQAQASLPQQQPPLTTPTAKSNQLNMPMGLSFTSMPKFSQLSQDLQLSESGSDSE